VNDARNVTKDRQQDVQPEMATDPDLQQNTEWRQKDGDDDANDIYVRAPFEALSQFYL
jgi:hypothetical protein